VGTALGQQYGGGETDAVAAAGHNCDLTGEILRHALSCLSIAGRLSSMLPFV
jgi:hypothetical protein